MKYIFDDSEVVNMNLRRKTILIVILILLSVYDVNVTLEKSNIYPIVTKENYQKENSKEENRTLVSSNITMDTIWTVNDNPYCIKKEVHIINNSTLFINKGVNIYFEDNGALISGLIKSKSEKWSIDDTVKGNIKAEGSADEMIKITSKEEDFKNKLVIGLGLSSIGTFSYCSFYSVGRIHLFGTDYSLFDNCSFYGNSSIIIDQGYCYCLDTCPSNNSISYSSFINNYNSIHLRAGATFDLLSNEFFLNNFINSTYPLINDISHGIGNEGIWNDSLGHGNYWSDYNGTDLNNDGIGDTNLPWQGVDWCPLMEPSSAIEFCNQSWLDEPLVPRDKDGDGMEDIWEERYNLDPSNASDANGDLDNDGLSNLEEFKRNTDPTSKDTDGDGWTDKWEIDNGFDPLDPTDAGADPDEDGLSNREEIHNNTEPFSNDSDGDGMPDGWEIEHGFDPQDPTDAELDADADGVSNLDEYKSGSDPKSFKASAGNNGQDDNGANNKLLYILGACSGVFLILVLILVLIKRKK